MNRLVMILFALVLAPSCMTPEDNPIVGRDDFVVWYMNWKAQDFLKRQRSNTRVKHIECRSSSDNGATWTPWVVQDSYVKMVAHIIACLEGFPIRTYATCASLEDKIGAETTLHRFFLEEHGAKNVFAQCQEAWDPGFSPAEVPEAMTDPDAVSADDIFSAFLRGPAPAPGWGFGGVMPSGGKCVTVGLPMLAGCPNKPSDSFGGGSGDASGTTGGDQ